MMPIICQELSSEPFIEIQKFSPPSNTVTKMISVDLFSVKTTTKKPPEIQRR